MGYGDETQFLKDKWLMDLPLCLEFPRLQFCDCQKKLFCQRWADSLFVWNIKFRRNFTDVEFDEWDSLLNKLQSLRLNNRVDVFVWWLENDGSFWVKYFSPKLIAKQIALERQQSDLILKVFCPKQVKVFFSDLFWKVFFRIKRILQSYALFPNSCVLCKNSESSMDVFFFFFSFAIDCWPKKA